MEIDVAIANLRHLQHKDIVCWYGHPFNPTDFGEAEIAAHVRNAPSKRRVACEAFAHSRQERQQ